MPSYTLVIAYTVENETAHTALIDAIVAALNDTPSDLALNIATITTDTGIVEDLLGPDAYVEPNPPSATVPGVAQSNAGTDVGDQPVSAPPSGLEPAEESLPSDKEF